MGNRLMTLGIGTIALLMVVLTACSSSSSPTPSYSARMLASDLSVGPNRLALIAVNNNGQRLETSEGELSLYYLGSDRDSTGELKQTGVTQFRPSPYGGLGVYVTRMTVDFPGWWRTELTLSPQDGSPVTAKGFFRVAASSFTPAIGEIPPRSITKTVDDVASLEELTSAPDPDPDLYQLTVAEAIDSGRPTVVAFSTPAFCTSAACGPQLEEVQKLKNQYQDQANFIHVEIFDNPHEIQGDPSVGVTAAAVLEWRLQTEPWTFILDAEGRVADKFEAFAPYGELEPALLAVLQ